MAGLDRFLDNDDIEQVLEIPSEDFIPSGSEDDDCSVSEDEFFDVGEVGSLLDDIDIPEDVYDLPIDPINVSGHTNLDLSLPLDQPGPSNNLPSSSQAPLPSDEESDSDIYNTRTVQPLLRDQRISWKAGKDNDYVTGSVNNPPPFLGQHTINIDKENPSEFFAYFFSEELIDKIVFESNRYAMQKNKENFKLTNKELKVFFGINLIMTYIHYPRLRMYWSSNLALRCSCIADAMTVNRFEDIRRYLHFTNNDHTKEESNKFWKLQPVLESLHDSFHNAQNEGEHLAIDEMMIPFKGRHRAKQYIKNKPKKWGFKMWVRASRNGYVQCFELYGGKKSNVTALGPVSDMVIRLCHNIKEKNHKLFMDNFFVTLPLLRKLKENKIYAIGTVRINRIKDATCKLVSCKKLQRGSTSITTSSDNITIVRWMDNREVHTASTYAGAVPEDTAKRFDKKTKTIVDISRPYAISEYNSFMGGVDMADRMIAHYPHGLKSKKWYLRVFFHLMNVSLVNAWLCYKNSIDNKMDLLTFKSSVANTLIITGLSDGKKRGRPSSMSPGSGSLKKKKVTANVIPELRYDSTGHWPQKIPEMREQRCRFEDCKKKTRYQCKKCKLYVCPDCMEAFHKK